MKKQLVKTIYVVVALSALTPHKSRTTSYVKRGIVAATVVGTGYFLYRLAFDRSDIYRAYTALHEFVTCDIYLAVSLKDKAFDIRPGYFINQFKQRKAGMKILRKQTLAILEKKVYELEEVFAANNDEQTAVVIKDIETFIDTVCKKELQRHAALHQHKRTWIEKVQGALGIKNSPAV